MGASRLRYAWNVRGMDTESSLGSDGWTHRHGRKNGVGRRVWHDGKPGDCRDQTCREIASQARPWGTWCPHGTQVVEAVSVRHTCGRPPGDPPGAFDLATPASTGCPACYPEGRTVTPWPCGKCTLAEFEEGERQAAVEYEKEMWDEYRATVGH